MVVRHVVEAFARSVLSTDRLFGRRPHESWGHVVRTVKAHLAPEWKLLSANEGIASPVRTTQGPALDAQSNSLQY